MLHSAFRTLPRAAAAALIVSTAATVALADVRHEGAWPADDRPISLKLENTGRLSALSQLADSAGWSVVARGISDSPVSLQVQDQPPSKVFDLLLADGTYVATRDGTLISLAPAAPAPAAVPAQDAEPEDRTVTGHNVRVEKNEVVGDVSVVGGDLDLYGTAEGDVSVIGGALRIHEGAHVTGDASGVGGAVIVDNGAKVDGEVSVLGASLNRGEKPVGLASTSGSVVSHLANDAGTAMEHTVALFLLGAVLLALASNRMETLEAEVAARPMKSLALGVVAFLSAAVAFIVLCVTVIGLPVALVGLVLGFLLAGAGICAVLTTFGAALLGHRTRNPYLHLAVGCVLFTLVTAIPYFGGFVHAAVALVGAGSLVATRIAGLLPKRSANVVNQGPYRTAVVG